MTGLGVERTLEHRTENGGRNTSPIELVTGFTYQQFLYLRSNGRNIEARIIEQTSVYIFEHFRLRVDEQAIAIARTQSNKQVFQFIMKYICGEVTQIITKLVLAKDSGILGIKAEHQANTQHVQFMLLPVIHLSSVLAFQLRIDVTNQLTCLSAYFYFLINMGTADVLQELHPMVLIRKVFQTYHFIPFGKFTIEVMDMKLIEIASHNPVGTTLGRHVVGIPLGLLVRSQFQLVALVNLLVKVNSTLLLFYQHLGRRNQPVDSFGLTIHTYLRLEVDELFYILHSIDGTQQIQPKLLCDLDFILSFFILLPERSEFPGGLLLFGMIHAFIVLHKSKYSFVLTQIFFNEMHLSIISLTFRSE